MINPKIAVIDVETPNRKNNCICSISVCVIDDNKIKDDYYTLVNPKCRFDEFNTKLHGITEDDVIEAPTFVDVWKSIKNYFDDYVIVGHNVSFDLEVINKELIKNRLNYSSVAFADTLALSRDFLTLEHYKLDDVCRELGVDLKNHHCAKDDCFATAEILLALDRFCNFNIAKYINQYNFSSTKEEYYSCYESVNIRYSNSTMALWDLQDLLGDIIADGNIDEDEINLLSTWLDKHIELKGNFPYDAVLNKICGIYSDGTICKEKCINLLEYISLILDPIEKTSIPNDDIDLNGSTVCLTGEFECMPKNDFAYMLESYGALIKKNVTKKLTYLIVGELGNPQWSQGSYGNKIKKALEYNDNGSNIVIIKESDFIDLTNIL